MRFETPEEIARYNKELESSKMKKWTSKQPRAAELRDKLLEHGGEGMLLLLEHYEPNLRLILSGGVPMQYTRVLRKRLMEPHRSHENSALCVQKDPKLTLCVGYALAGDRWVQHSWLMKGEFLVETTYRYDKYFGVPLTGVEAQVMATMLGGTKGSMERSMPNLVKLIPNPFAICQVMIETFQSLSEAA